MPGIHCRCGKYFGTGSIPCDYSFHMFSERDYDAIDDPVTRRTLELLYLQSTSVHRCPHCSRLIILDRHTGRADFFVKEEE
jgi:hypothetical protein